MANEVSAWLAKLEKLSPEQREAMGITDEDIALAKKEHLLERDYTKKSQQVAALSAYGKIQEQFPQATPEQIAQLTEWYLGNRDEVTRLWNNRDKLVERQAEPAKPMTAAEQREWRKAEAAAMYETASMRSVFEDLHKDAVESATDAAYKRWDEFYRSKEVPRLDQVAAGYLDTVVGLMDFVAEDVVLAAKDPKHQRMNLSELIKQAALRVPQGQRADFRKVASQWREEQQAAVKPIEEDAYKRGLEEGRKAAEGPSGPMGGARPGWRPETTEPKPKTRDELFAKVVSAVEQKSGRPVPL